MPGQKGIIKKINTSGELRRRLLDMGLIKGTEVSCLFKSFCGDPKAYRVRGTVIALRNNDSALIDIMG
ncbi:MAG: ferrous iron transport protein A [Clostridia bacterium]|jgi:ferrous iron transport protein A|nr:ferrous iron transport protein A [Clostridia bacterium]